MAKKKLEPEQVKPAEPQEPAAAAEATASADEAASTATEAKQISAKKRQQPAPAVSRAFIKRKVTLGSRYAQKAYDRSFKTMTNTFYILGIVLRIVGTEEEASQVEAAVDTEMDDCLKQIEADIFRLEQLAEDNGIDADAMKVNNTNEIMVEAMITTPRSGRFLGMIQRMDDLMDVLAGIWFAGLFTDRQYSDICYGWQRRITRMAHRNRVLVSLAMRQAKDDATKAKVKEFIDEAKQSDIDYEPPEIDEEHAAVEAEAA